MEGIIVLAVGIAGGYVASIYTWPWLRKVWNGVGNEIVRLENRAKELRTKLGIG